MTLLTTETETPPTYDVLGLADVADAPATRRRGLIGLDRYRRVLVLEPASQIHTFGMRFAIDVAWCDRNGIVLRTARVVPNRLSAWVLGAHSVLEAEAGAFSRLGIGRGDRVRLLPVGGHRGTLLIKCPPTPTPEPHLEDGHERCTPGCSGVGGYPDREPR